MGVIECFTLGRDGDPGGGEDHVEITADFYGLFDGVTSRGRAVSEKLRIDSMAPGRWAARTLGAELHAIPADAHAHEAFERLSEALVRGMVAAGAEPSEWGWPAAAQSCIFSLSRRQLWRLGDALVAVNGERIPDMPTPLDEPATGYRAAALWALIAAGADREVLRANDPTREMLLPLLELQHNLRNCSDGENPFAYYLLDGRPLPADAAQVLQLQKGDEVVLATDGYLSPGRTLAEAEKQLAGALESDPLMIKEARGFRPLAPGASSFDDRAYLRFVVD